MRWLGIAVLAVACNEFGLDPVDREELPARAVVEDRFVQAPLPSVDLLFVIDDTASMAQEQAALAEDLGGLASALDALGVRWQAGVVTTDLGGERAGWLVGDPWILAPTVDDVDALLVETVRVGTSGSGPEAGLAAAVEALALAAPGGPNHGFRRSDASLHVLFLSDADDESDAWYADPVDAFLEVLDAEGASTGIPARASAVVGDLPGGCTSLNGSARAADRYHEVVEASGGVSASICSADFGPILSSVADVAVVWESRFPLRAEPAAGTVRVSVDDVRLDAGWTLESDPAAVVFDEPPAAGSTIVVEYVVEADG